MSRSTSRLYRSDNPSEIKLGKLSSLEKTVAEKDHYLKTLQERLSKALVVQKSLTESQSRLIDQDSLYKQKLEYIKSEITRQKTEFREKEQFLVDVLSKKQKEIDGVIHMKNHIQSLIDNKDKTLEKNCEKFETSMRALIQSLNRTKHKGEELEKTVCKLQKDCICSKSAVKQFEIKEKLSSGLVKQFLELVQKRDEVIGKEKVKHREVECNEEVLTQSIETLQEEIKDLKKEKLFKSFH